MSRSLQDSVAPLVASAVQEKTSSEPGLGYGPEPPARVLARLGSQPGPTLICVAGLHGNEPMGVVGLERALERLEQLASALRGQVIGLVGNRKALTKGRRFIEHDLNRAWFEDRIESLRGASGPLGAEDEELVELFEEIEPVLERSRAPIYLLDLHTTSGPGPAFAVLEDTLANRSFALNFPVPMVLGFEEEVGGTLSDYLCERGVIGIGFEAGQHQERIAADRAEAAVWIALEASGLLTGNRPELAAARRQLEENSEGLPPIVEVRYRHAINGTDGFAMAPEHRTFQPVEEGQVIARDSNGPVASPTDGLLLMPLYQAQGDDGFFVVRSIQPVWLKLSAMVRRFRMERVIHWMPGVRKHTERPGAFVVDRKIARLLTLELFHLLGFKRLGPDGRFIVLVRRSYD